MALRQGKNEIEASHMHFFRKLVCTFRRDHIRSEEIRDTKKSGRNADLPNGVVITCGLNGGKQVAEENGLEAKTRKRRRDQWDSTPMPYQGRR